ncbi:hypothetical protein [Haloparvum sp. PAK95]|uniref:hypothetical protein n=1 Tax=Haloparvum sp. PAK95 TaxID=3418962 RepID=UPI003D2F3C9B
MSRREPDRVDALLERLALPFVFGMALGVAVGRQLGSSLLSVALFSLVVGTVLFALFAWLRLRIADLPE